MGQVEEYWDNLRLLRFERYVTSGAIKFTEEDIRQAKNMGIDLIREKKEPK